MSPHMCIFISIKYRPHPQQKKQKDGLNNHKTVFKGFVKKPFKFLVKAPGGKGTSPWKGLSTFGPTKDKKCARVESANHMEEKQTRGWGRGEQLKSTHQKKVSKAFRIPILQLFPHHLLRKVLIAFSQHKSFGNFSFLFSDMWVWVCGCVLSGKKLQPLVDRGVQNTSRDEGHGFLTFLIKEENTCDNDDRLQRVF